MTMHHLIGVIATSLVFAATARAQKDVAACKPVFDAMFKVYTVPTHSVGTMLESAKGAKPTTIESIRTTTATYVKIDGKWRKVPMTQVAAIAQEKENIENAKAYSCKPLRQESVNGVSATVYAITTASEDDRSAGQIWIAKGSGLVLRQDTDTGLDDPTSKMHMSLTYDYSNVQAPPGVQ
ncbi:MAG: hypothetical protein M3Y05_10750 [Gemmatimonadota bacterium]|nr:hypothetical protein [Gemmatimonadota bacterium]